MIKLLVTENLERLLAQEDTDGDRRITVRDQGPRRFEARSTGGESLWVEGTYALSVLLQELALCQGPVCTLDPARLQESPVSRTSRHIREHCWTGLTRRLDIDSLASMIIDEKMPDSPRLYLSPQDREAWSYYRFTPVEVVALPEQLTPTAVQEMNSRPGLLGLALRDGEPLTYVVPGGRFNEMYGWDSYFIGLGLLADGKVDLARAMVEHLCYQIRFYGKVLNANRSYYLTRSQPPFLTAFALAVHRQGQTPTSWLGAALETAIHEYQSIWTVRPRLTRTGLSRYRAEGIGIPPETEPGHYDELLAPYAARENLSVRQYRLAYLHRQIVNPELDEYFEHDRTVRESGHDTSYRLEGCAKHLCTVDLNSLLYRYEVDLAGALDEYFGGSLAGTASSLWRRRAARRAAWIQHYCWDEKSGQYFDYNLVKDERSGYTSATGLWPLWAGLASQSQVDAILAQALPLLECPGGLAGSSRAARESGHGPERQWDYPYGWAPHQMLAWEGLRNYQRHDVAERLALRWLTMIARNAARFNGVIPEKYDVVQSSHEVFAEYGNVGSDFSYITREGFGWTNASFQIGLNLLSNEGRQKIEEAALDDSSPPPSNPS